MSLRNFISLLLLLALPLFAKIERLTHNTYTTPKKNISKKQLRKELLKASHEKFLIEYNEYFEEWLKDDSFFIECSEEVQSYIIEKVETYGQENMKTEIVRETWIEKSYYLKTRIVFDPMQILRSINKSLELHENSNEL